MITYSRHELTKDTRQYGKGELEDLVDSIQAEGQLVPALLWFNVESDEYVLVDGWHRQLACDELGKELITTKLRRGTKESKLPKIILDIQLNNKMAGKVQSNCEAIVYLEMVKGYKKIDKMTKAGLVSKYSQLADKDMERLKKIKELQPGWFATLRAGNKVDIQAGKLDSDGPYMSDSPYSVMNAAKTIDGLTKLTGSVENSTKTCSEFDQDVARFTDRNSKMYNSWVAGAGTDTVKQWHKNQLMSYGIKTYGDEEEIDG